LRDTDHSDGMVMEKQRHATDQPALRLAVQGCVRAVDYKDRQSSVWITALPILLGEAWLTHHPLSIATDSNNDFPGMVKILGFEPDEAYRRTVGCGFRRADECECMFTAYVLERLRALETMGGGTLVGQEMLKIPNFDVGLET
jgi:hypothetical protein